MFLIDTENDIADFLEAVSFLPPKGFSVDYFIVPQNEIQLSPETGFELQTEDELSQTYSRVQPIEKIDQAVTPAEYNDWSAPKAGKRGPQETAIPRSVDPEELPCPFVKELSESNKKYKDLLLKENFGPFPKGTVFHCVKNNPLKEAYSAKNLSRQDSNNLSSMGAATVNSVDSLVNILSHFISTLKAYKSVLSDHVDFSSETIDIASKYSKNNIQTQAHILPGVITAPAQYNINELKSDHNRLQAVKQQADKVKSETDIYMRILSEDMSIILKNWKKVNFNSAMFSQLIEVLNASISNPY